MKHMPLVAVGVLLLIMYNQGTLGPIIAAIGRADLITATIGAFLLGFVMGKA